MMSAEFERGWQKVSSILMYTVGKKYILNLFKNKSDLQIIKHNLSEIDTNILRLLDKPKIKEEKDKYEYNMSHFALLVRAKLYLLSLENLNNYEKCTDPHYELFFYYFLDKSTY